MGKCRCNQTVKRADPARLLLWQQGNSTMIPSPRLQGLALGSRQAGVAASAERRKLVLTRSRFDSLNGVGKEADPKAQNWPHDTVRSLGAMIAIQGGSA